MSSRIESVIAEIEDYIDTCKPLMISNAQIKVNKEELEELLTELRQSIPEEVRQYQKIISNQDAILNNAKSQADTMVAQANKMTEQLVDEHEIMQKAYAEANRLIDDANTQAQEIVERATAEANSIKTSAIHYTDNMLNSLQTIINHSMEGAQSRFDQFISSMQSSYNIVDQNRGELASSLVSNEEDI